MDTIIISRENNILHVFINDTKVDYTLYNFKGHSLDGGQFEYNDSKDEREIFTDIIDMVEVNYNFTSPFYYLKGKQTEKLLELIQFEDEKNLEEKLKNRNHENEIEI